MKTGEKIAALRKRNALAKSIVEAYDDMINSFNQEGYKVTRLSLPSDYNSHQCYNLGDFGSAFFAYQHIGEEDDMMVDVDDYFEYYENDSHTRALNIYNIHKERRICEFVETQLEYNNHTFLFIQDAVNEYQVFITINDITYSVGCTQYHPTTDLCKEIIADIRTNNRHLSDGEIL
jgi:hypothetical protein